MTLESKLSEMAEEKINKMAEEEFPLKSLADFSMITALQVAYMKGIKDALALPEVAELVEAADKFINSEGGMDESFERLDALKEALAKWNAFVQGDK